MSRGGVGHTKPLSRQRSEWAADEAKAGTIQELVHTAGMNLLGCFVRPVHDGHLRAIHTLDDGKHHLSVSFTAHRGSPRYPTWDELAHARHALLPDDLDMVMHLPPPNDYVAVHDTTFHLHETA